MASFQYTFTLGSWSNVEESSGCGTVANRNFGFQYRRTANTADATCTASDTVAAWASIGSC